MEITRATRGTEMSQEATPEFHAQVVALEKKADHDGLTVVEALNLEWLYDEGGY